MSIGAVTRSPSAMGSIAQVDAETPGLACGHRPVGQRRGDPRIGPRRRASAGARRKAHGDADLLADADIDPTSTAMGSPARGRHEAHRDRHHVRHSRSIAPRSRSNTSGTRPASPRPTEGCPTPSSRRAAGCPRRRARASRSSSPGARVRRERRHMVPSSVRQPLQKLGPRPCRRGVSAAGGHGEQGQGRGARRAAFCMRLHPSDRRPKGKSLSGEGSRTAPVRQRATCARHRSAAQTWRMERTPRLGSAFRASS